VNILITGASTGIGHDAALYLSKLGHTVYAGVRDTSIINASPTLIPIELDVTQPQNINNAVKQIKQLDVLINNAGITVLGPLEWINKDELMQQLQVNVIGVTEMIKAFLPALRQSKGKVINMGSTAGFVALPFCSAYAASKYALEGLSDALRLELDAQGVKVILIRPGSIATPIWDKSFKSISQRKGSGPYKEELAASEKMVRKGVRNAIPARNVSLVLEKIINTINPKDRYEVGPSAIAQLYAKRLLSTLMFDRIKLFLIRRNL